MGLTFSKKNKVFELPCPLAPLYDTHAHLRSFWGDDKRVPAVLARAAAAGVASIVTIYDPVADLSDETPDAAAYSAWLAGELDRARSELEANPGLTCGPELISAPSLTYLVGVHPYGAPDYSDAIHAQVEAALADPLCVGVGEIGLDYHFDAVDDIRGAGPCGRRGGRLNRDHLRSGGRFERRDPGRRGVLRLARGRARSGPRRARGESRAHLRP